MFVLCRATAGRPRANGAESAGRASAVPPKRKPSSAADKTSDPPPAKRRKPGVVLISRCAVHEPGQTGIFFCTKHYDICFTCPGPGGLLYSGEDHAKCCMRQSLDHSWGKCYKHFQHHSNLKIEQIFWHVLYQTPRSPPVAFTIDQTRRDHAWHEELFSSTTLSILHFAVHASL